MKDKKGFTLIELLAVIAILAILMLMVTPNILKMFTQGQESGFSDVVQSIWRAAETDYLGNAVGGANPGPYCNKEVDMTDGSGRKTKVLNLSGKNKNLNYFVEYYTDGDKKGEIKAVKVANDAFYYDSSAVDEEDFAIDNIKGVRGGGTINCATGELTPNPEK